jgi:Recombination endonuclease VII
MESLFPDEVRVKKCYKCQMVKPLTEFWIRQRGKDAGRPKPECKDCGRAYRHSWYLKNKDRVNAEANDYKKQNPEWYAAWQAKNRVERHDRWKHNELRIAHGIGLDEYRELEKAQGGLCAICGEPQTSTHRQYLCVDHDHKTRKVRGLLCGSCNMGLGRFKDDPVRLRAAAEYLERQDDG